MDLFAPTVSRIHITFYDPHVRTSFDSRSQLTWNSYSNAEKYLFRPNDYISLRYSESNDYPAIDCTFVSAFVMPAYYPNAGHRLVFGVQESNFDFQRT